MGPKKWIGLIITTYCIYLILDDGASKYNKLNSNPSNRVLCDYSSNFATQVLYTPVDFVAGALLSEDGDLSSCFCSSFCASSDSCAEDFGPSGRGFTTGGGGLDLSVKIVWTQT